jgi:hypothetical protein
MTLHDDLYMRIGDVIGHSEMLLSESEGALTDQLRNDIYAVLADAQQFQDIVGSAQSYDLPALSGDLSTLLMNIGGFSQLMLEFPEAYNNILLNETQHARIEAISENGRYLLQLLDQL